MPSGPAPVFLLVGDPFLTEKKYLSLLADLRAARKDEVSAQTFYLSETPLDNVLAHARNLPFLAAHQVFRVREADTLKEKKMEALDRYLAEPAAITTLIFETDEMDRDHPLAGKIAKAGTVLRFEKEDRKNAGERYLRDKIRRAGKTLTAEAEERLKQQAGDAPGFLDSVLDQLILYLGEATEINEGMVESFQENWSEPNVFALTDALVSRKPREALIILRRVLEQGERELVGLVGLLHWQIRRFWQARVLMDDGTAPAAIWKKCRISPKQAPFFQKQLQGLTRRQLEKTLEGLFQLDWKLKTGRAEGDADLEAWVVQATGK